MLIVMKSDATAENIRRVEEVIEKLGFRPHVLPGEGRTAIGVTGNSGAVDPTHFENLEGVAEAIRVTKQYKLISKDLRPEKSIIKVGNATIGGDELALSPDLVRSKRLNKSFPSPNPFPKAAQNSFAAARSNRALRLTLFKAKVKTV